MDCWLAGVLAMILLPLTVMALSSTRHSEGWPAVALLSAVVLHGSLALRRWQPLLGSAAAGAAMLGLVLAPHAVSIGQDGQRMLTPILFQPSSLVFLPVLYSAAVQMRRAWSLAVLACSIAGTAIASVRIGQIVPTEYPIWQYRVYAALALLLVVVGTWGLGLARTMVLQREATAQAELTRTAILAERSRIARDIHDIVAHSLAVIVRQAEGGAVIASKSPERATAALRAIAEVGREALDDMRGLLGVLNDREQGSRPPDTSTPASLADLEPMLERVRGTGLTVRWAERGSRYELGGVGELVVHHVVLEALTNTLKHAGASAHAAIVLDWRPNSLLVEVTDDGGTRGGQQGQPKVPGTGVGLRGLAERVSAVDGVLTFGRRGQGFLVRVVLPRRGTSPTGDGGGEDDEDDPSGARR
jgi:signal transduction histidine kinase